MKHDRSVSSAAFSPDGMRVMTTSDDKTARLWDVLPINSCLIDTAYRQLEHLKLLPSECTRCDLNCQLDRTRFLPECDDVKATIPETRTLLSAGLALNQLLAQPNSCRTLSRILNERLKKRHESNVVSNPDVR